VRAREGKGEKGGEHSEDVPNQGGMEAPRRKREKKYGHMDLLEIQKPTQYKGAPSDGLGEATEVWPSVSVNNPKQYL